MRKTALAALTSALLLSCGGGGSNPKVFIDVVPASIVQLTDDGRIMVVLPYRQLDDATINDYGQRALALGAEWIYIYDEMFLGKDGVQIGLDEVHIQGVAAAARGVGLKPAVTIVSEIVLRPEFALVNPNAYSVIGIVMYPALGLDWDYAGHAYIGNLYTTMLVASIERLRAIGYTNEIWYLYQGPSNQSFPPMTAQQEREQADTILWAWQSNEVSGLVEYNY